MNKRTIIITIVAAALLVLLIVISIGFANVLGLSDTDSGSFFGQNNNDYMLSDYLDENDNILIREEDQVCDDHNDCRAVNIGCCVTMGAVNKSNLSKYHSLHNQYKDEVCVDSYCAERSCSTDVTGCLDEEAYCVSGYCRNGGY